MANVMRFLVIVATLSVIPGVFSQGAVEISLKHDSAREARTRDQLQRLLTTYDVSPWLYTRAIVIDERAIPFSHPVLTLHTRHEKDDDLLLSTFVHEQIHWWFVEHSDATELAIRDLRQVFPSVPAGGTAGARDEHSTYLHLLVCYLEQQADLRLLGELQTKQVMDFWASDHYTWVYQTVIARGQDVRKILDERKLMPATARAPAEEHVFVPEVVFAGRSEGKGEVRVLAGHRRAFTVESLGTMQADGRLRLEQRVRFANKPAQSRSWVMWQTEPGHYAATLTGAAGPVVGHSDGSRLTLRFPMNRWGLVMHQTLDLSKDGRTLMNSGSVRLFGIQVAHLKETIQLLP